MFLLVNEWVLTLEIMQSTKCGEKTLFDINGSTYFGLESGFDTCRTQRALEGIECIQCLFTEGKHSSKHKLQLKGCYSLLSHLFSPLVQDRNEHQSEKKHNNVVFSLNKSDNFCFKDMTKF